MPATTDRELSMEDYERQLTDALSETMITEAEILTGVDITKKFESWAIKQKRIDNSKIALVWMDERGRHEGTYDGDSRLFITDLGTLDEVEFYCMWEDLPDRESALIAMGTDKRAMREDGSEDEGEKGERQKLIEKGELWEAIPLSELEKELGAVSWLWPDWIPRGFVTLMSAPGESGKSLLALSLVKTILTGGNWPDGQPAQQVRGDERVIWIEAEAGQVMLNERVKALQIPKDRLFLPSIRRDKFGQPDLSMLTHQRRLWRMVEELQPVMVVVDSLGQVQTRSESRKAEIARIMTFFQHLARDNDIGIPIVHHFNKPQQFQVAKIWRVRGHTSIANACKSIIGIERKGESKVRKVCHVKTNLSVPQPPFAMIIGGSEHLVEFEPWREGLEKRPDKNIDRCAAWLRDCLIEHGPQRPKTIIEWGEENEGFSRATVYRAKDKVEDIVSIGAGPGCKWELRQFSVEKALEEAKDKATS